MRRIDYDKLFCEIGKLTVAIIGMCAFATGGELLCKVFGL